MVNHRVSYKISTYTISLESLNFRGSGDEEAVTLLHELKNIPEFSKLFHNQPFEPFSGICWLQCGRFLFLWVDHESSVIYNSDLIRAHSIENLWCSTRSGQPAKIIFRNVRKPDI